MLICSPSRLKQQGLRSLTANDATYQWCCITQILSDRREKVWTFLWLSHNSEKGYAVIVTFCHHRHTACHTTSVSLSTYCDITMAATVTMTLVKEVVNMQISLNSAFWRTTTCITVKILFYKNDYLSTTTSLLPCFPPWTRPRNQKVTPLLPLPHNTHSVWIGVIRQWQHQTMEQLALPNGKNLRR